MRHPYYHPLADPRHGRQDTSYGIFVRACRAAGTRNLIDELFDPARISGNHALEAAAAAFQPRPIYTAEELAALWPMICVGICGKERVYKPGPKELSLKLMDFRMPLLRKSGGWHFEWEGKWRQFFIVSDINRLSARTWTQAEFEELMGLTAPAQSGT